MEVIKENFNIVILKNVIGYMGVLDLYCWEVELVIKNIDLNVVVVFV